MSTRRRRALDDSEDEEDEEEEGSVVSSEDNPHDAQDQEEEEDEQENASSEEAPEEQPSQAQPQSVPKGQTRQPKPASEDKPQRKDPALVPKGGAFFLHDDRGSSAQRGGNKGRAVSEKKGKPQRNKKVAEDKWAHDKFDEVSHEQDSVRRPQRRPRPTPAPSNATDPTTPAPRPKKGNKRQTEHNKAQVAQQPTSEQHTNGSTTPARSDQKRAEAVRVEAAQPTPTVTSPVSLAESPKIDAVATKKLKEVLADASRHAAASQPETPSQDANNPPTKPRPTAHAKPKGEGKGRWKVKGKPSQAAARSTPAASTGPSKQAEAPSEAVNGKPTPAQQATTQNAAAPTPSAALLRAAGAPEFKPSAGTVRSLSGSTSPVTPYEELPVPPRGHTHMAKGHHQLYGMGEEWVPMMPAVDPTLVPGGVPQVWNPSMQAIMVPQMPMLAGIPVDMSPYAYGPTAGGLYMAHPAPQMVYVDQSGNTWYADPSAYGMAPMGMPMAMMPPPWSMSAPVSMPLNVDATAYTPSTPPVSTHPNSSYPVAAVQDR